MQAYVACVDGWLIAVWTWLSTVFEAAPPWLRRHPVARALKRKLVRDLRSAVRYMRIALIGAASARAVMYGPRLRPPPRTNAGPGFLQRRPRLQSRPYRRACAGALKGAHVGSLRQRVARLRDAIRNVETLLTRVAKRLTAVWRHPRAGALVLIAARDEHSGQTRPVAASADTS